MSVTDEEEQALIAGAKAGDTQAFEMLVERYERQVYRAAYFILRDPDEAEEIAQEAFMRGYRAIRKFKEDQPFRPWILKIAVNQALTASRKLKRRRETSVQSPTVVPSDFDIDEALIDRQRADMLIAALNQMQERERVVIYLRYFMDFSEKELAQYLKCAQGTVKSRLHRSLAKLREIVVAQYPHLLEEIS